jgi:hypothetical protein
LDEIGHYDNGLNSQQVASMNAVESRLNEASDSSIPLHFIEATRYSLLGTPHPRRNRLSATYRLHPLESGQAWLGKPREGDWPHSSFHGYVAQGIYPENWGNETELPDITVRE